MANSNDVEDESLKEKVLKTDQSPAQIPLLEDVIYNTSLPFPPQLRRREPEEDASKIPLVTDLFGGTPKTATAGPYSVGYKAESITSAKIKQQTSQMIDTQVQEYPEEIVRRLRDELSAILDELDLDNSKPADKQP